jgi:hypothetical protein
VSRPAAAFHTPSLAHPIIDHRLSIIDQFGWHASTRRFVSAQHFFVAFSPHGAPSCHALCSAQPYHVDASTVASTGLLPHFLQTPFSTGHSAPQKHPHAGQYVAFSSPFASRGTHIAVAGLEAVQHRSYAASAHAESACQSVCFAHQNQVSEQADDFTGVLPHALHAPASVFGHSAPQNAEHPGQ